MVDQAADQGIPGGGVPDLVSTQKTGVQNLGRLVQGMANAYPPATASTSPVATGVNNLGTTATTLIGSNALRHGIIFHNPATTSVNAYIFPSGASPAPTLASTGGAFLILPGDSLAFPPAQFPNANTGFSGFVSTSTNQALTIWEFL